MAKNKKQTEQHELEGVGEVLTSTEQFIEKNQKSIIYTVGIIVLIVLGVMAFRNFYLKPREVAAENAMFPTQRLFTAQQFETALNGDGEDILGFKEIASKYSMTKSGKLSKAYMGICEYKLGNYNEAIKYLTQYDGKDIYFKTSVIGLIGDSYAELGDKAKAESYYKKAVAEKNDLAPVYLKKLGVLLELNDNKEGAAKAYKQIKDDYPQSQEAFDIDKYLARVEG